MTDPIHTTHTEELAARYGTSFQLNATEQHEDDDPDLDPLD